MIKLIGILLLATTTISCTTSMQLAPVGVGEITTVDKKNYVIGQESSVYVGSKLIERKSYSTMVMANYVKPSNEFSLTGGLASVAISMRGNPADKYQVIGVNELGNKTIAITGSHLAFGITKDGLWDKTVSSPSFWTSPVGGGSPYTLTPSKTKFIPAKTSIPIENDEYINHELIYTGVGSDGIHLLYREYTFENMARKAFSQELVYPVKSKQIRFRNYSIKVINNSPSQLTYIVESE